MPERLLPIGISDFKRVIDGDYAYIDKTLSFKGKQVLIRSKQLS